MVMKKHWVQIVLAWAVVGTIGESLAGSSLMADLNGDGKADRVSWEKMIETVDDGEFFRVRVHDAGGALLWASPKVIDTDHPLAFGNWHFGYSLPQVVDDIDDDGIVDLIAPVSQSDVSPTHYRTFEWRSGQFVPVRTAMLLEAPRGSGKFPWSWSDEWQGTWISEFKGKDRDGEMVVEVFEYEGGVTTRTGTAKVVLDKTGARMTSWIKPLAAVADLSSPASAGEPMAGAVVIYRTRLGKGDHFNSSGTPLRGVGAILRQDRANYHKGKGDREDGPDPLFSSVMGRAGMDARTPVPVEMDFVVWRAKIIDGAPMVEVEVTDREFRVRVLP